MVPGVAMTCSPLRLVACLLMGLTLAACSSGDEILPARSAIDAFSPRLKPSDSATGFPEPTRAQLDADGRDILRADLPDRGAKALLLFAASNGPVETWRSADGGTFSFWDGVVIQTRGLGPDLMSSSAPSVETLARGAGQVMRVHDYLGPNDQTVSMEFTCTLEAQGEETVTVVEIDYRTNRVAETCEGEGTTFQNLYWFEGGTKLRRSLQWIGPDVGNLELFDLRR